MTEITEKLHTALADRYRIVRHLGEGGMATVYLAHDERHDRHVALKVLRPELAAIIGAERFLHEIKVTANLQHPHIVPLHDSGDADGSLYYVMPYIEGDTLRDKLKRERQLGIEEAIEITRSIASALDYAHRQGVIHRDIKPENILLHDGQAMVADFGIALAVSQASGQRLTETGLSIGTPHYMSPEQAMGDRALDARTDIYSLGAMLYEMLAGDPPYTGSTAQAVVAKVITEKAPPVTAMRDTVPAHVNAAVAKALAKMPADRFSTAAAFSDALANPGFASAATTAAPAATEERGRSAPLVWVLGTTTLVFAALAAWGLLRPSSQVSGPVTRYDLTLPELEAGLVTNFGSNIALSPDGRRLVYAGAGPNGVQLWLRERNRLTAQPIPGGDGAHQVFFSPDGQRVGFITGNRALRVASLTGEPPVTLVDSGIVRGGGAWGEDGYVYFVAGAVQGGIRIAGLSRMHVTGGAITPVTTLDTVAGEQIHVFPEVIPGGRGIAFVVQEEAYQTETSQIAVVDLRTNQHSALMPGTFVRWSPTGHLIVVRSDGSLVAVPFDADRLEATGPPTPMLEGVGVEGLGTSDIALSSTGTLMYQPGVVNESPEQIVWRTRSGAATPVDTSWTGNFGSGSLSPDGTRLALELVETGTHVWIKQLDAGPFTKMTFEGTVNGRPTWTPDGRSILFTSNRGENFDVYTRRADGSSSPELLLDHERPVTSAFVSRDGRWLVYAVAGGESQGDILARRMGDTTEVRLVASGANEYAPALSPDGRWLAYVSGESGTPEVYVRPFPTEQARWQISTGGGSEPLWASNGRELFFRDGNNAIASMAVIAGPTFIPGLVTPLFSGNGFAVEPGFREYDVTPDGDRFFMNQLGTVGADARLIVVDNWFTELRERVGRP
jgi:serine/threonine-protein kinase